MSDTVACKAINGAMQKAGLNFAQLSERSGINETRVSSSALPCSPYIFIMVDANSFLQFVRVVRQQLMMSSRSFRLH